MDINVVKNLINGVNLGKIVVLKQRLSIKLPHFRDFPPANPNSNPNATPNPRRVSEGLSLPAAMTSSGFPRSVFQRDFPPNRNDVIKTKIAMVALLVTIVRTNETGVCVDVEHGRRFCDGHVIKQLV